MTAIYAAEPPMIFGVHVVCPDCHGSGRRKLSKLRGAINQTPVCLTCAGVGYVEIARARPASRTER
jgi:DnaJ-class molecular chaperone